MSDIDGNAAVANLPPRQRDVVNHIISLTEENGYPPTLAELAAALGLKNRMTVHQHVAALKKKGLVHWEPGLNRSLKVVGEAVELLQKSKAPAATNNVVEMSSRKPNGLPMAGTIAAGQPIDALQTDEYLEIDKRYTDEGCYALKVRGDSMIEDGIYDGDYVIIKPNPSPRNGEVVVALLEDGSATLKRFFKEKTGYRLQPANSEMAPIYVEKQNDLQIQGSVVALFRKL
ncbi:MAG TPA: transcriptional repressor LexA [Drouetiella sp.]